MRYRTYGAIWLGKKRYAPVHNSIDAHVSSCGLSDITRNPRRRAPQSSISQVVLVRVQMGGIHAKSTRVYVNLAVLQHT